MILLQVCWEFFKIGLFTVGGGLATLPFLTQLSARTGWFTLERLSNMVAISESTPGPLGINMATYVGYHVAGISGGILASLSMIAPSFVIVILISRVISQFQESRLVQNVFTALRAAVTGLIMAAGYSLISMSVYKGATGTMVFADIQWLSVAVLLIFLVLTQLRPLKKMHPIAFIAAGAVVGILLRLS